MTNILIVEDEKIVAWDIKEALEKLGHRVYEGATTASEAILTASVVKPDLVLMDIQLQGEMNGIAAAEEIYRRYNIPVVYLTAYADEQTLAQATQTNPFGYIVKPFQSKQLHTTIQIALQRHQLEQSIKQQQAWLSNTLTSIGDAAIATDLSGIVTFMNPMAEHLTGWRQQDALGRDVNQIIPLIYGANQDPVENPGIQVMRLGYALNLPDGCLLLTKDGAKRVISDSAAPIKNQAGEIVGSIMIFQDKTDVQYAQTHLLKQIQDLKSFQWSLVSKLQVKTAEYEQAIACIEILDRIIAQSRTAASEGEILNIILHELGAILETDYCWAALHNEKTATSVIVSEHINPNRQNVYASALGAEVDLQLYPNFYHYLFKQESWVNPDVVVLPQPYQFPCSSAQQRLICPIVAFPQNSYLGEAQVVGEMGIITTGKPSWRVAQVQLISRIVSYGVQLFRQPNHSDQDVVNAIERLTRLRDDFMSSVSEELLNPLLNMKKATEILRRLHQFLKDNPTQTGASQEEFTHQNLNQYLEIFQEEWQKEFDFVHDLLNFKFLYELQDEDTH
jgi:PAS domain S-box-containing protein